MFIYPKSWPHYYHDYYEACPHCSGSGYRIRRRLVTIPAQPVIVERVIERVIIRKDDRRWR